MMKTVSTGLALVGGLATLGCADVTGPKLPAAARFEPMDLYAKWWREVEECAARHAPMAAVHFYRVIPSAGRDSLFFRDPESGAYFLGEWVRRSNSLYFAAGQLTNPGVVRHEMLHAILRDVGHPPEYFDDRCGPLVAY